jgi:hypothetical protein
MKRLGIVLLMLLVALVPGQAVAHGIGWWGPGLFLGGLALGTALTYPYYYPYPAYPEAYPYPALLIYQQAPPLVQRDVCYEQGCYHLYGNGMTQPWQWVWTPAAPPVQPSPPPPR